MYIDFKNAFGSLDHARLLTIMQDLGYPTDAVALIGNIYSQSTTTYIGEHFGQTKPIPIQRGTIQGDTLSPYLFIIFLEPLLRWLQQGNHGYQFGTSTSNISSAAYADDLAALTHSLYAIQIQLNKIERFSDWTGLEVGTQKCAVTRCPNKSKLTPTEFKTLIQTQNTNNYQPSIKMKHTHIWEFRWCQH